ncbi:hypothetical protein AHEVV2_014 [Adoxophyes honmai entomopoxvirus 'L' virophage 2]|nr:hypothetical protein AHEVV2_014 [Adoxophyes honmai entomopoxvirus 'L' virophage 2]
MKELQRINHAKNKIIGKGFIDQILFPIIKKIDITKIPDFITKIKSMFTKSAYTLDDLIKLYHKTPNSETELKKSILSLINKYK